MAKDYRWKGKRKNEIFFQGVFLLFTKFYFTQQKSQTSVNVFVPVLNQQVNAFEKLLVTAGH